MKTYLLLASFLLALLGACKHPIEQEEDFLGPQISPEQFSIREDFKALLAEVNLQNESQSFKALFSNKVKWFVSIKGLESGAIRQLSGTSNVLDISNTAWDGDADSTFFFRTGEECSATLSMFNNSLVQNTSFKILAEKKYEGILIDDFEGTRTDRIDFSTTYTDPLDQEISIVLNDSSTSVQGKRSLLMSGLDADTNYWIGGVQTASTALKGLVSSTTDPSTLFFNVSIFGTGTNDAGLSIKFFEDDDSSGAYEAANDDAYSYVIKVDWKGWKRVYVPYASFGDDATATGNNTQEPNKWTSLNLALAAFASSQKVSLNADFMLVSTGSALPNSELK